MGAQSTDGRPVLPLEGERLTLAVAGILLIHAGMRPGRRVHVQSELDRLGIFCTPDDFHNALRALRRRGLVLDAEQGRVGYTLCEWMSPCVGWTHRTN